MKKLLLSVIALFVLTLSVSAMGYEQARQQALFLTDKMAYELNLTEEQYRAAYEVNLDYLMSVNTVDDLYGAYWTHRNMDLSYILLDWQYRQFLNAAYFYRPLTWSDGYWRFGIYARYPRREYLYFGRPVFYTSYRGGHSWRYNGGRSWYRGRTFYDTRRRNAEYYGMRDGFRSRVSPASYGNRARVMAQGPDLQRDNRPRSFGNMQRPNTNTDRGSFGNRTRQSSTRTTVTRPNNNYQGTFGGSRSTGTQNYNRQPSRTFLPSGENRQQAPVRNFGSQGSFGGSRGGHAGGNFGGSVPQPRGSFGNRGNAGGGFGGHR